MTFDPDEDQKGRRLNRFPWPNAKKTNPAGGTAVPPGEPNSTN
jgi:hypothetical protein